jgi:hypothetical protein
VRPPETTVGKVTDIDLLLDGAEVPSLHDGVLQALKQAVLCLQKSLFLPSVAMLAASAEAQWIECGRVVARSDAKILEAIGSPYTGIGKIVQLLCNHLNGPGKETLKAAGVSSGQLLEAQSWTVVLREHRNALHWGKSGTFVKSYEDVAPLLMAAPIHLGTLERLRRAGLS